MFISSKLKIAPSTFITLVIQVILKKRMADHKEDKGEIELIYYEAYPTEKPARTRERKLKQFGSAWRGLKQRLNLT